MVDIEHVLRELSAKRPVFHSEADFQHALAWEIHQQWPDSSIRLEFKPPYLDSPIYLDFWADGGETALALELKYTTRALQIQVRGESFDLLNHAALPLRRYDFLKDIQRLESVVSGRSGTVGYGIFLTNNSAYWSPSEGVQANDASFRIHEGQIIWGELGWGSGYSASTIRGREASIFIKGSYRAVWHDYSEPGPPPRGKFRYLLVNVIGGQGAQAESSA